MHLILTGATGLVGSAALSHILSLPTSQVSRLTILSRNTTIPLVGDHPNVKIIQHSDFNSYPPALLEQLNGADGVIWALGISQSEVAKEKYIEITKDYTLAAAKSFSTLSDNFKFVYVSGEGATLEPGRFTPIFGRVKGETEAALLELGKATPSLKVYSARPAFVDSKGDTEVEMVDNARRRSIEMRATKVVLGPVIRSVFSSMVSPTKDLGRVLTELAMSDGKPLEGKGIEGEGRTVRNEGLRRMAGL